MPFRDISNKGAGKVQSSNNKVTRLEGKSAPKGGKDFKKLLAVHKKNEKVATNESKQKTDDPMDDKLEVIKSSKSGNGKRQITTSGVPTPDSSDYRKIIRDGIQEITLFNLLMQEDEKTYEDEVARYFERTKKRGQDMWYCSLCNVCLPFSDSGEMEERHCNGRKHKNASQSIFETVTKKGDTKCHCTLCDVVFYVDNGDEIVVHCKGRKHRQVSALPSTSTAATGETSKKAESNIVKGRASKTRQNSKIKPPRHQLALTAAKVKYGWVKDENSISELDPDFFNCFQSKETWNGGGLLSAILQHPFFIRPIVAESPDEFFDAESDVEVALMKNGLDFVDLSIMAQASNNELHQKWKSYMKAIDEKDDWAYDLLAKRFDSVDFLNGDMDVDQALKGVIEDKESESVSLSIGSNKSEDPGEELKRKWAAYLELCDNEKSESVPKGGPKDEESKVTTNKEISTAEMVETTKKAIKKKQKKKKGSKKKKKGSKKTKNTKAKPHKEENSTSELEPDFFKRCQREGTWDEEALLAAILQHPFFVRPIVAESPGEFYDAVSAIEGTLTENGLDFIILCLIAVNANAELYKKWDSYVTAVDETRVWAKDLLANRLFSLEDFHGDCMDIDQALKYVLQLEE